MGARINDVYLIEFCRTGSNSENLYIIEACAGREQDQILALRGESEVKI